MLGLLSVATLLFSLCANPSSAWPYDERHLDYNLNQNKDAQSPLEYSGKWENHGRLQMVIFRQLRP